MKKIFLLITACLFTFYVHSQEKGKNPIQLLENQQDSTLRALIHIDSVNVQKDFASKIRKEKLQETMTYPVFNAGKFSGVIPVKDPTEIPDPSMDYKLMFDIAENNPDSLAKEINSGLAEIARTVNLHVASGIPLKKIFLVIIVHGPALNAITNNEYYKEHFKTENPNIKLVAEMANMGAKFIACGQAMAFLDIKREVLLPQVKVTLSAKTAMSSYRLKGYIK